MKACFHSFYILVCIFYCNNQHLLIRFLMAHFHLFHNFYIHVCILRTASVERQFISFCLACPIYLFISFKSVMAYLKMLYIYVCTETTVALNLSPTYLFIYFKFVTAYLNMLYIHICTDAT